MRQRKHIYRIGMSILSDGVRIPGWWKGRTYQQMRAAWGHATLLASVLDDIMNGEVPPR